MSETTLTETIKGLLAGGPMTEAQLVEATGVEFHLVRVALTQMDVAGIVGIDQSQEAPVYSLL